MNKTRKDEAVQESDISHAPHQGKAVLILAVVRESQADSTCPLPSHSHSKPPIQRRGRGKYFLANLRIQKVRKILLKLLPKNNRIKLGTDFSSAQLEVTVGRSLPGSRERMSTLECCSH